MKPNCGAVRPVVENVKPELSSGRFAIKRAKGDSVTVEALAILDGHDLLRCDLLYKKAEQKAWSRCTMQPIEHKKDQWRASFVAKELGTYLYTVEAWLDRFETWRHELKKKFEDGQDVNVVLEVGAELLEISARLARKEKAAADAKTLAATAQRLRDHKLSQKSRAAVALKDSLAALMAKHPDTSLATRYERELRVTVDPERAVFSAWYEFFPRSTSGRTDLHGTFRDSEKMIPYVASMGFDVIYLPPIHPIGTAFRKGKNNSLTPHASDPGSPWGIGAPGGGHKSVHPQLGTLADFKRFQAKANAKGIAIALDIAFQCSPDHPYVQKHPEWFRKLPDGTIAYAENPPKKYQDIYPFNFETEEWSELWDELKSIVTFWCRQGVRIFRVDNPHTKSCRFWEWMIAEVKREYPETIFLSEAFTRPAMMYHLAKIGFTQSYTYFTWRNAPAEFKKYMEELTQTEVAEFYRPNFWPNTPDILPIHLQKGGRPAFLTRVALAATLSSTYGLYGPAYELGDNVPFKEGGEEYLDSEKYEIKAWDLNANHSIKNFIGQLNRIRRENPALHRNSGIRFHDVDNDQLVCFSKRSADGKNIVLVAANLDFHGPQAGEATLNLADSGLDGARAIDAQELLTGKKSRLRGGRQKLRLTPESPVTILRLSQGRAK